MQQSEKDIQLYAHSVEGMGPEAWETLQQHLEDVRGFGSCFAAAFDAQGCGAAAGYLHDLGKAKDGFQRKLHGLPSDAGHSAEGAQFASEHYGLLGKLLAYAIAGHHAGMPNGLGYAREGAKPPTPLDERLKEVEGFTCTAKWFDPAEKLEIPPQLFGRKNDIQFATQFLTRMLFSALVDGDRLATEAFYVKETNRGWDGQISDLLETLRNSMDSFLAKSDPGDPVNQIRTRVLQDSIEKSALAPGLFSLTVPTGGGKTLTSLRFALEHMQAHGLRRLIYVAPYTSIIEQTADVFREHLGDDDAVLEHHSAFEMEKFTNDEDADRQRMATQNWDRPVVVTTAVQLFESLFSNHPSKCRKLHNLAKSVILLDEAQNLPLKFLEPCLAAIRELSHGYGASVVLCTATQPAIYDTGLAQSLPRDEVREIAPEPDQLYEDLRRVEAQQLGPLDNDDLVERLQEQTALVIVNNKKHARLLFDSLQDEGVYHLTTNMTGQHRRAVLKEVRARLKNPQKRTLLIATALVEAGVDLDFPQVWRALAGVDSLVQAAGRCNRNGKAARGQVFVFEADPEFPPPPELKRNGEVAEMVLRNHEDPLSPEAVHGYFSLLYDVSGDDLDAKQILKRIQAAGNKMDFPFADISYDMKLIEDVTVPLIIAGGAYGVDEDPESRRKLDHSDFAGSIARAMQPYTVGVSRKVRGELIASGSAVRVREKDFGDQFVLLTANNLYDAKAGFSMEKLGDLGVNLTM